MTYSLKELPNQFEVGPDAAVNEKGEDKDEAKYKENSQELLETVLRQVILAAARMWIAGAPPGRRVRRAAIDAAGGQATTVYRLSQDTGNFLRKSPVFRGCFAAQRLFQVIWYVSTNKNAFAIGHFVWGSLETG